MWLDIETPKQKKFFFGKELLMDDKNLHIIIENAPVMINAFDPNGRCLLWNKKSEEILGWSREYFLSHLNPLELIYPSEEMQDKVLQTIRKADGKFRTVMVKAKDRSSRIQEWATYRFFNGFFISFGIDITEKRKNEKLIRENEARFRAFTEAIPDILFIYDKEGRYIEIFTTSEELLIGGLDYLKKRKIPDVLPEDVAKEHLEMIEKTLESQQGQMFEYELEVSKGRRWFESRTAPIKGLEREGRLVASSVRDITQRKLAEKQAHEKEKLAAVIETAGAVCHEFNQPLHIISGCCELLMSQKEILDDKIQRKLQIIFKEVERMGNINRSLMNITSYKTKTYVESKIIDINQASES